MITRTKICKEAILLTWGETFFEDYPKMMYLSTVATRFEVANNADTIKSLIDDIYENVYPTAVKEVCSSMH